LRSRRGAVRPDRADTMPACGIGERAMDIDRRARRREGAAAHVHSVLPSCLMLSASSVGELQGRLSRPRPGLRWRRYPIKFPELYASDTIAGAPKGVMLFGPPGTGRACAGMANPSASASVGRVPGIPPLALPCFWDLACVVSTAVDRWATLRFTALAPDDACKGRRDRERRLLHRPPLPLPPP
jgi:hypothetical protein